MKTEKIIVNESSRCINIVANRVESLRINNDVTSTMRVYDNGCIGVEGRLGQGDFAEMEQCAKAKLQQGIAYPETHEKGQKIEIDSRTDIIAEKELVGKIERLLARLGKENPDFLFNNKIMLNSSNNSYVNSDGADYNYKGNQFICSITIKFKGSANIMDESFSCESDYYDEDQICHDVKLKCDAFLKQLPQVEQDDVVIIGDFEPIQYAINHLIADMYFNKASAFDGKLGQKMFTDKLNIAVNRNPKEQININFFDAEGVVNKDYKNYVIRNGVWERTLNCKKSADQYNTELLGSASASYNGVPSIGIGGFDVESTAESLTQLVDGKAIYVSITSGGDMTPSGDFSLPVMVAYLYENGKLLGKLPEFAVSGNLFDILGKDFVGVCQNGLYNFGRQHYFVYKAKLVNKK